MNWFTYVCPKGELAKDVEKFLFSTVGTIRVDLNSKRYVETRTFGNRFCADEKTEVRIVKMRSWDIPQMTELIGDYGIVGKDIFEEYCLSNPATKLRKLDDLDFGYCELWLLGRKPLRDYKQPIRVASPYPKLSERKMKQLEIWAEINPVLLNRLGGSWEALIDLDVADLVVEVVDSGITSEANELKKLEKVLDSNAILIERV